MIIEAVDCLVLHCSRCNKPSGDEDEGVNHWTSVRQIEKAFPEGKEGTDGWRKIGDRYLCEDCHELDQDGEAAEKGPLRGIDEAVAMHARLAYKQPDHSSRRAVAIELLDHLDAKGIPGSPIRHRGEEIWLHTTGQVEGWLRTYLENAGLVESVEAGFKSNASEQPGTMRNAPEQSRPLPDSSGCSRTGVDGD